MKEWVQVQIVISQFHNRLILVQISLQIIVTKFNQIWNRSVQVGIPISTAIIFYQGQRSFVLGMDTQGVKAKN